ncbi:hypothetical protein A3860_14500 [Niastella vici]|uniref:Bacterial transcription activator effector binding domain-containing protein n=1 Tax=Niastella vici TaxID=1703345 RepID=A0A1V9G591_9BACT|nr:GyrI-like domain-containing protein [Niastella vici]OQP65805.1 hypothetical protein A3860_14500 [Niastella vici]
MKKWLLIIFLVIVASIAGIYIFIPAQLNVVQITPVNCTTPGAYRHMTTVEKWKAWWPGSQSQGNMLRFQNSSFVITKTLLNTFEVRILHNELPVNSTLHLLPAGGDSITMQWSCSLVSGLNPFKRVQQYQQAVAIKNNMAAVLGFFKSFAEKKENIYGISLQETIYRDSLLIGTKTNMSAYPSVAVIYSQINSLKKYSATFQAQPAGKPIMSITPLYPFGFQVLTALPVNRSIPARDPFYNQRIPLNRFLVTRVHGGDATVNQALHQIQLYIQDYHRTLMALPFQQLVTDRSAEPDTTRWVTDIYVPLF